MARMIKLNNNGSRFLIKLIDCQIDQPFNLDNVVDQFIVFTRYDGTIFEKQGTLVEDLPDNPGQFNIQYVNDLPEVSILDQIGNWSFTGKVELDTGDLAQASTTVIFWVV